MPINRTYYTPRTTIPADIDLREDLESTYCCFNKGYTPPPFQLEHVLDEEDNPTGKVKVKFELTPFNQNCNCQIECTTRALVFPEEEEEPTGSFCPADTEFEVVLPSVFFSDDAPTELLFTFEDAKGNVTTITVSSLVQVIAQFPLTVVIDEGPRKHIQIGTPVSTSSFYSLFGYATQYQIERYVQHESNRHVWVDWTPIPTAKSFARGGKDLVHWDRDVRPGVIYGYRVRFRSTFDHASRWSAWSLRTP
jgi:hypothetical protein